MATDVFRSTSSTSIFGRARSALVGFLLGPLLLAGAAILIFWNESHSVRVVRSLKEGAAAVQEAKPDRVDPANESRLLHLTGDTSTDETLRDPDFAVEASGVRLVRDVQVYEWTEKESSHSSTSIGGTKTTTKTYKYETKWEKTLHPSSHFKKREGHENPAKLKYSSRSWNADTVSLGAFQLDPSLTAKIQDSKPIELEEDSIELPEGARLVDNQIYVGEDPAQPKIGDLRVTERLVAAGPVSVIAQQGAGARLTPFHTRAGEDIGLVETGSKGAGEMFLTAKSQNQLATWIIRGVGFVLLVIGFALLLGPIGTMTSIIPLLGGLMEAGVFIISLIAAAASWALLVSAAWMIARPLLGGTLFAAGTAVAVLGVRRLRRHAASSQAAVAAAQR